MWKESCQALCMGRRDWIEAGELGSDPVLMFSIPDLDNWPVLYLINKQRYFPHCSTQPLDYHSFSQNCILCAQWLLPAAPARPRTRGSCVFCSHILMLSDCGLDSSLFSSLQLRSRVTQKTCQLPLESPHPTSFFLHVCHMKHLEHKRMLILSRSVKIHAGSFKVLVWDDSREAE